MSTVTITISVQSDAPVSVGTDEATAATPAPLSLEELGTPAESAGDLLGPPSEEFAAFADGTTAELPEPMPLDELEQAAAARKASSKKTTKKTARKATG